MSSTVKFLIGLVAAALMGWLLHGPLGRGEAFIGEVEARAQAAVAKTEVPGISVRLSRDPLSRMAILSGPADQFQREGQGELKGLNDIVAGVEGVSGVQWADEGPVGQGMPWLLESLIGILLAYLAGVGIGRLLFGRPKKESYL